MYVKEKLPEREVTVNKCEYILRDWKEECRLGQTGVPSQRRRGRD